MYFPADGSFPADWRGCTFPLMVVFPQMARIGPLIGADFPVVRGWRQNAASLGWKSCISAIRQQKGVCGYEVGFVQGIFEKNPAHEKHLHPARTLDGHFLPPV
jgi:hypothetical protein